MNELGKLLIATAIALFGAASTANAQSKTLDAIKQRGSLSCGVNGALAGFGQTDGKGNWTGLDVDYCKAIAAAIFGDATRVKYIPMTAQERFAALRSGDVDVLIRNTSWTGIRDSVDGLSFTGVNYYDGQGFMVKASLGLKSATELIDVTVCVAAGTTTELHLASYFKSRSVAFTPLVFEKADEAVQAYLAGRCAAYTTDMSGLHSTRVQQARPKDHLILPEIISKEPLGPSVRPDDPQWFSIVRWVHYALLNAEELDITQANIDQMANSTSPDVRLLLGVEGAFARGLGLDNEFATRMIRAVGNYGEIFERNVGSGSRLKIARGLNNLWNQGGLQFAPPIR